jgi:hypothetical protein
MGCDSVFDSPTFYCRYTLAADEKEEEGKYEDEDEGDQSGM